MLKLSPKKFSVPIIIIFFFFDSSTSTLYKALQGWTKLSKNDFLVTTLANSKEKQKRPTSSVYLI